MGHDYKNIAIIGAGASGCICAYWLIKFGYSVTLFDKGSPLRTILPTGGGRCNLAHAEYDTRELAKNYPRGEKFLYSIFSKFSTADTLEMFEDFGIKTYTQENGRIFPESNSAKEVRDRILEKIRNANFIKEEVIKIEQIGTEYKITTTKSSSKNAQSQYLFTHVILSIGGHSGCELIKNLGINIIEQKPSLVGLNSDIKAPSGVVLKNIYSKDLKIADNILFTHFGISGPITFKISSLKAYCEFPYTLKFDLYPKELELQNLLNIYPHKDLKNILSEFLPLNFVKYLLGNLSDIKAHKIDGKTRDLILNKIHNFEIKVIGTNKGEETVSAGGVDLKEINSKTMEVKKYPNLYCIGEILNIDGFCGGFNLQNAWSTGYICAEGISNSVTTRNIPNS